MKNILLIVIGILVIAVVAFVLMNDNVSRYFQDDDPQEEQTMEDDTPMPVEPDGGIGDGAGPIPGEPGFERQTVIGTSIENRDIVAYHYGTGDTELLFVGGIHGGYAWNTVLVARELMNYLEESPAAVPDNVTVTVIPVLNPDGLATTVGTAGAFTTADVPATLDETIPGRFNANDVDLNRNFDCDWEPEGTWQRRTVSGGRTAFSEPESQAVREYVLQNSPDAVVVYYSAAGGVFASNCRNGVLPETLEITSIYAESADYPAFEEFDFYEITGDMVNWLAREEIPGISVLLSTHDDVEWTKNRRGIEALFNYYAE